MGSETEKYPDRYVITGLVADGERKGERVWIWWSEEGGGWWQWGPEGWAMRFESIESERYKDALRCATGKTWTKKTVGPWYCEADISTIETRAVPAIVTITVR